MKLESNDFDILKPFIKESIVETLTDLQKKEFEKRIYNIRETAELLGKSRNFTSDLMKEGILKTTMDNKHVTGKEINRYLGII